MRAWIRWLFALLTLVCVSAANLTFGAEPASSVNFARDVAPIIEGRCLKCHNASSHKGDLSLATVKDLASNDYVLPGKPDESYLLDVLTPSSDGERPAMPKEGKPLSAEQVAVIRRWVAEGAVWPAGLVLHPKSRADASWWSLQPLSRVEPPQPDGLPAAWSQSPIDRFVFAKLAEKKLQPNPPASKRDLIRRATYDLIGLPPTPEQVEAFLADESPQAYEKLIDRLLASPHYGEHWGRHWLDVVRFGESNGFERNVLIADLWPYRDYVIRSFNEDKPFDQLVREHLAGDVIGPGDPDVETGTAFLVCGPYDNVGNQDPVQAAQIRANTIDEIIRTTTEAFLGLTVGCARCHDHKFDPILQQDYYGLYATFAGVYHGSRTVATPQAIRKHTDRLKPFNEEKERLTQSRSQLEDAILTRANQKRDEFTAAWTRPPVDRTGTEERFAPIEARWVRLVVEGTDADPAARSGYRIDEFEVWTAGENPWNVALAENGGQAQGASRVAEDFADAYSADLTIDGQFGARWIAAGPELTVTLARPELVDRVLFSSDRSGAAGDHPVAQFVSDYRIEVSPDGKSWTEVASSHNRRPVNQAHERKRLIDRAITDEERGKLAAIDEQLARVNREIAAVKPLPNWWLGDFRPAPGPFYIFIGGNPQRPGEAVVPAGLSALSGVTDDYKHQESGVPLPSRSASDGILQTEDQRRLAFAKWIVSANNPLTPRVLANRQWHYHFGTGIVDTPSDFGYMGGRPTHPELLDWLARQIQEHGWRLKPVHRLIMLSQTYRQSCDHRPEAAKIDAGSRYLWRFPPRRLSAEEIRDTMLSIAGKLDATMGGPGFRLYRYIEDNVATYVPLDQQDPQTYRRTVYHQNARAARTDLLTDFDSPDCAFATPRRASTTTPLQALTMMNHSFTLDMAGFLADRLRQEAGSDPADQVRRAFLLAYCRPPADEELKASVRLIGQHGLRAFCRVLFNTNELIYLH